MVKRIGLVVAAAALLALAPVATTAAGGMTVPLRGSVDGFALYGYGEDQGTNGLGNVLDCNINLGDEFDFYKVTTFTAADGTMSHLGRVHVAAAHCPTPAGPTQGQIALVAANGDVLYGEYTGTYEEDGTHVAVTFMGSSSTGACYLLDGVACESTGRFEDAVGQATMVADAYPGDENDPFVPWPWWATWMGSLSY